MSWHEIKLPAEFGYYAVFYLDGDYPDSIRGTRSYDSEWGILHWNPKLPAPFACDMECLNRPSMTAEVMREKFGIKTMEELLWRWVVTEVLAKLYDIPIVFWVRQRGVAPLLEPEQTHDLEGARILLLHRCNRVMAFGFLEGQ